MEEYLDEWNGYAFTGHFAGRGGNGQPELEYVIFVFSSRSYLFAQRARLSDEALSEQGVGDDARTAEAILQQEALSRAKDRLRKKDYQQYEQYE